MSDAATIRKTTDRIHRVRMNQSTTIEFAFWLGLAMGVLSLIALAGTWMVRDWH